LSLEVSKLFEYFLLALESNVQCFVFVFLLSVDPTKIKRITRRRRYPEAEEYQRRLIQEQMQQTFDNLVAESQKNMEAVFLENSGN
jgi:thymidylate kinase